MSDRFEDFFVGAFLTGIFFMIVLCIGIPFGIYYSAKYQCKVVNEQFGKNYKTIEFLLSRKTIMDYLNKGEQKTFNVNLKGENE